MFSLDSTFVFSLPQGKLSAPAFSWAFKFFATAVVLVACAWGGQLWFLGILSLTSQSSGLISAALLMMIFTLWHVLRGRTQIDTRAITQSWMWDKRMELSQLAYAKLLRVRRLEWLVAPRLYTRSFAGKMAVFYAADPALLAVFSRLEFELRAARHAAQHAARR